MKARPTIVALRDAVIDAAVEWHRLVDDLDAPAVQIRPALQRLDLAVTNLREATRPPCPPCTAAINKWLDSTPAIVSPGPSFVVHAAYDATPAGMRDNRTARYERWRTLVRDQTAAIRQGCRDGVHAAPVAAVEEV